MNLVIDKANFSSLLKESHKEEFQECNRLIKRGINIIFNFSKEEILNSADKDKMLMWLNVLTQGLRTHMPKWEKCIDSADLKTNFTTTLSSNQKRDVYLLDNSNAIPKIKEKGAILIGGVGEEINTLMSLVLDNTETLAFTISSWTEYCPKLPVTDIIICDNHYFKSKEVCKANENDLIEGLCTLPTQSPVNCIIIAKQGEVDPQIDLSQEVENIKKFVKRTTDSSKSSVSIITTYKTHDRNAITNYYRLKCGCCFHLKKNNIKKDVTTEIKTHANLTNEAVSLGLLNEYQQIINNVSNQSIFGDKKCNFLYFPD
jgi:hypothetical protein